jgi:hypothetical protein
MNRSLLLTFAFCCQFASLARTARTQEELPGPLVDVGDPYPDSPIVYHVPREDAQALLKSGTITRSKPQIGRPSLWFATTETAMDWFRAAKPISARHDEKGKSLLQSIGLANEF